MKWSRLVVGSTSRPPAAVGDGEVEIQTTAYAREEETKKGMDGSQITGTASSYARKYALNGMFCIDDTKDSDATNTHGDKPEAPKKKKEPSSKTDKFNQTLNWLSTVRRTRLRLGRRLRRKAKKEFTADAVSTSWLSIGKIG